MNDEQKMAIADVLQEDYDLVMRAIGEQMPHCWLKLRGGLARSTAIEYVRHLELAVGGNGHNLGLTRHHPDCDGKCEHTCRLCEESRRA